MAITSQPNDQYLIMKGIEEAIRKEVEAAYDRKKEQMVQELEKEKSRIVAGILLGVMKQVDISYGHERMVFTVRMGSAGQLGAAA